MKRLADPGAPQQDFRRPPPQLCDVPSANRAAGILRLAAMSLGRTETALGAFYRRLAFRGGKAKAITATARKLAILVYRTLNDQPTASSNHPGVGQPSDTDSSKNRHRSHL